MLSILKQYSSQPYFSTLLLLCVGYFIDFYDLTIFASSYTSLIPSLFNIVDSKQIQITYLNISNFYTAGILLGSLTFGFLGDKFGRSAVIKYSILLYSLATLASIFASSIYVFTCLRFICGFGLATEFATSSVLIAEIFASRSTPKYTALLYISGIMGGILATYLGMFSWQLLFLFGGLMGLLVYLIRQQLKESPLFLNLKTKKSNQAVLANFKLLVIPFINFKKTFMLFLLILPYNLLISIMFIFPSFMKLETSLTKSIHELLLCFFIGNIISTFASSYIVNYFKQYNKYLIINSLIFGLTIAIFPLISNAMFIYYALLLGLLGGGLPTIWIQIVAKSYTTEVRNTATNTLFAAGRCSTILLHIIIAYFIGLPNYFISFAIIAGLVVMLISLFAVLRTQETYGTHLQ